MNNTLRNKQSSCLAALVVMHAMLQMVSQQARTTMALQKHLGKALMARHSDMEDCQAKETVPLVTSTLRLLSPKPALLPMCELYSACCNPRRLPQK